MNIKFIIVLVVVLFSHPALAQQSLFSLKSLCEMGSQKNPSIKALDYRILASKYHYKQATDKYKPHITFRGNVGYEQYDNKFSSQTLSYKRGLYEYFVDLKQPIYEPQIINSITDAKLKLKLSRLEKEDRRAKLIVQIAKTAIELIRLNQIKVITEKKKKMYQNLLEITQAKYDIRYSDKPTLFQAKAQLKKVQSDLVNINQIYRFTLNQLKSLVNTSEISEKYFKKSFHINPEELVEYFNPDLYNSQKKKIDQNTQIGIYKLYLDIAKNNIQKQKIKHYPTVNLDLSYGNSQEESAIKRRNSYTFMFQLQFPIYQGGEISDQVHKARWLYEAAKEDYKNVRLKSNVSFETDWKQIISSISTINSTIAAVKAAKVYLDTTIESFRNGIKNLTDVQLAEASYYNAKVQLINAEATMLQSLTDLYYYIAMANCDTIGKFESKYLQ
ncbi:Type I secretion outer membrane protein, TolC precursor [Dissulfuribacter thermophilus]|uniref:Type I secretion outer membrane protein, TolC n=1 Tax=Dissulfuribacter thermophilus TaxID=1156395 RepID=A0A1B9F343_9BACT|nr:TolC family protein [Dissulfuribacter thermophilus]OCC14340.1 Type I secretion outer membrane protein, TolC precursor [Dissulfuribacter thermophilus]